MLFMINEGKKRLFFFLIVLLFFAIPVFLLMFSSKIKIPQKPAGITPSPTGQVITSQRLPSGEANEWIMSLIRGQTASIPESSIEITFVDAVIPGENCYDCASFTTLEAKNNGQIKKLEYSCGGITGECITEQKAYGYSLEIIEQPNKDLIKIKVKRE